MQQMNIKKYTGRVKLTNLGWEKMSAAIRILKKESSSNNWIAIKMEVAPNTLKEILAAKAAYQTTLLNLEKIFKNLALGVPREVLDYVLVEKKSTAKVEEPPPLPLPQPPDSHAATPHATARHERSSPEETPLQKIFELPYEPDCCFEGREKELDRLRNALSGGRAAATGQKLAITGLGGIGKTQLALKYATLVRAEYDVIFWVHAETEESIRSGYMKLPSLLNLAKTKTSPETETAEPADPLTLSEEQAKGQKQQEQEQAVSAALRWLDDHSGWLLILDNADTPEILNPYLPSHPKGDILITARAHQIGFLNIKAPVRLEPLSAPESLDYFLNKCERPLASATERGEAAKLAEELGYLPLAMAQAAAYILENDITFAAYRELRRLEPPVPPGTERLKTVYTTWDINCQAIVNEAQSAHNAGKFAPELLELCAFLAPDDIPMEIVTDGAVAYCPSLGELLAVTSSPRERRSLYDEISRPLTRYSLVTKNVEAQTFSIHRIVQEAIRANMSPAERREWQARAVRTVDSVFPDPTAERWPLCQRLQPHAIAICEMIVREKMATEEAGRLLHRLGEYLYERGRYALATPFLEAALKIRLQIQPSDDLGIAARRHSLGLVYHQQQRYEEAELLYNQALQVRQQQLSRGHPDILESLNDQAALHTSRERYPEAQRIYLDLLALAQQTLSANDERIANILHNLAWSYQLQGRDDKAEPQYKLALRGWENASHQNHPIAANSFHNLAEMYRKQKRFEEAEPLYKDALRIQEYWFPDGHSATIFTYYNMSLLYTNMECYAEAITYLEKALEIERALYGENHPDVIADLKTLEDLRRKLGEEEA